MSTRSLLKLLAIAVLGAAAYALNRSGAVREALEAFAGLGPWAPVAFIALHAASTVLLVPSIAPTSAAGALFGISRGLPLTLLGAGLGAVCAFWIGRGLARSRVERLVANNPQFHALSRAVQERGWKIVTLARLSPIFPFAIGNYAFGLSAISTRHYFLASVIGTVPSNAVYVYLGAVVGELGALSSPGRERSGPEWVLLVGGLLATAGLALYLRRLAREALERHRPE